MASTNQIFYSEISQLKDLFHKYGRFDDSNAKLDEISKYLAMYVYQLQNNLNSRQNLSRLLKHYENDSSYKLVPVLKQSFEKIALAKEFLNDDGSSIFGSNPSLNIELEDDAFAYHLLRLVVNSVESIKNLDSGEYDFDILNETFGHFVRDNFRNHIEDAQYMTPAEAVDFMVKMALSDLEHEEAEEKSRDFVLCDPCCGVGSFLSAFYKQNKENNVIDNSKLTFVGQDKVTRMVRLSKINMMLFNNHNHFITTGNSLVGESAIDTYKNKIDLILTNPPFGARFSSEELIPNAKSNYPFLHDIILKNGTNFNSETLFLDRCLSLLKPNGRMLAVLPDSVISSAGLNSTLRHRLIHSKGVEIRAIVELPSVAFAQAGTRTKTSILYLQKRVNSGKKSGIFMSQCERIGFEVSSKKGSTIKLETGQNDLPEILQGYRNRSKHHLNGFDQKVISDSPSCVLIKSDTLERKAWTPSHYNARSIEAVRKLGGTGKEIELVKLIDIVDFHTGERKKEYIPSDSYCISVLHVLNDDNLNYEELIEYKPKYPGIVCRPGDLLFSKINPRILRVLVVPELGKELTCSSEFEIMNSRTAIGNYGIKLLLMSPSVQTQINYLTSGTSSSHNRIKSGDLANVLIPLPKQGSKLYQDLQDLSLDYEKKNKSLNKLRLEMTHSKKSVFELLS